MKKLPFEKFQKEEEFVQEHLYIEDMSLYYQPKINEKKEEVIERGVIVIDIL
jgi:hypothetical protein